MSRKTNRLSTERLSSMKYAARKSKAAAPPCRAHTPPSKASVAARSSPKVLRVVVHGLDHARGSQRSLEPAHIDGATSFRVDHREDGLLIRLGGLHLKLVHE